MDESDHSQSTKSTSEGPLSPTPSSSIDSHSPPDAVTSGFSAQPTYTTAGTLYNPSAPPQPPTRRGRCVKWGAAAEPDRPTLFPKELLASLVNGTFGADPGLDQYTPLQQNTDRAVSPVKTGTECSTSPIVTMAAWGPGGPPRGGSSASSEIQPDLDKTNFSPFNAKLYGRESPDSEGYDEPVPDHLAKMSVKSLHNLASYPNPNQKAAQRALRRGLRGVPTAPRLDDIPPPSLGHHEPTLFPVGEAGCESPSLPRGSHMHTPFMSNDEVDHVHMSEHSWMHDPSVQSHVANVANYNFSNVENGPPQNQQNHEDMSTVAGPQTFDGHSSTTTLASAPGAPQPLTAGPPGQRQYRPSTFESTFRAMNGIQPPPGHPRFQGDYFSGPSIDARMDMHGYSPKERSPFKMPPPRRPHVRREEERMRALSPTSSVPMVRHPITSFSTSGKSLASPSTAGSTTAGPSTAGPSSVGSPTSGSVPAETLRTEPAINELLRLGDVGGTPVTPGFSWTKRLTYDKSKFAVCDPETIEHRGTPILPSRLDVRYDINSDRETMASRQYRAYKINRDWYAGSEFLAKSSDKILGTLRGGRRPNQNFGAIGDGRPMRSALSIDKANKMTVGEHCEPLLNVAAATLERHREEEQKRKRVEEPKVWNLE